MKVYYDLHIHSVLSACADVLQTPNNILNMSMLKGLNMIAICDHNGAKQYETIELLKDSFDFTIIYGMEITVQEGFHILAYFETMKQVMELDKIIDRGLDKNIKEVKGQVLGTDLVQVVCDEYDEEKYQISYYLNQNLSYTFSDIIKIVHGLNGLVIPAHIERKGTGILDYIEDFSAYDIDGVEIYNKANENELREKYPYLKKYKSIYNSDAHDIDRINERVNFLDLDDNSYAGFKKWLTLKEYNEE